MSMSVSRRLDTLRRRADFLADRIDNYTGKSASRDKAERAALLWAIDCCEIVLGLEGDRPIRRESNRGEQEAAEGMAATSTSNPSRTTGSDGGCTN